MLDVKRRDGGCVICRMISTPVNSNTTQGDGRGRKGVVMRAWC